MTKWQIYKFGSLKKITKKNLYIYVLLVILSFFVISVYKCKCFNILPSDKVLTKCWQITDSIKTLCPYEKVMQGKRGITSEASNLHTTDWPTSHSAWTHTIRNCSHPRAQTWRSFRNKPPRFQSVFCFSFWNISIIPIQQATGISQKTPIQIRWICM